MTPIPLKKMSFLVSFSSFFSIISLYIRIVASSHRVTRNRNCRSHFRHFFLTTKCLAGDFPGAPELITALSSQLPLTHWEGCHFLKKHYFVRTVGFVLFCFYNIHTCIHTHTYIHTYTYIDI